MVISGLVLGAIAVSVLVWFCICVSVALLMFGDDRAFSVGPVIATFLVALFWLVATGVIRFA